MSRAWHLRRARLSGVALGSVLLSLAAYVAYAYVAYNRVPPANLPCRGCSESSRTAHVNGYDLYYREVGTDTRHPPVVILHGGPGQSSRTFKGSMDFLARDYRVVYYDQRGSGQSQIKPRPGDYRIEQLVEELDALRRDVAVADQIVVVGHSFGGALAQRYALAHPSHVFRLVLVGSIRINNGMTQRWLWKIFGPALYSIALGFPPRDSRAADAWIRPAATDPELIARVYDRSRVDVFTDAGYASFAT